MEPEILHLLEYFNTGRISSDVIRAPRLLLIVDLFTTFTGLAVKTMSDVVCHVICHLLVDGETTHLTADTCSVTSQRCHETRVWSVRGFVRLMMSCVCVCECVRTCVGE